MQVETLFTHPEGYRCARWGRPIVPVVFGVEEETLRVVKGAIEAVVATAGHKMADHDPELGANLMIFFLRDWAELDEVPNLAHLLPEGFTARQQGSDLGRIVRFDGQGAIRMAMVFIRIGEALADAPAELLMLDQAARSLLTWAPEAELTDGAGLHPSIAGVLRAAYDPVMPVAATDPSHALRLAARL